jgi:hypothetical protein
MPLQPNKHQQTYVLRALASKFKIMFNDGETPVKANAQSIGYLLQLCLILTNPYSVQGNESP